MYSADDLKQDILANVKGDNTFSPLCFQILQHTQFRFNDSSSYTRIQWNTYQRNLVIFCASEDKKELEKYKQNLYSLCYSVHGTQDDYIITSLEIIAKSDITPVSSQSLLTDEEIIISNTVKIDRTNNNIGNGGFGEVYQYYDENKEELVAYKIYQPSVFQTSEPEIMKKRFLREGKKLLSYAHPHIVRAYDYGFLGDESAYIKMEFISGNRLSDFIIEKFPLEKSLIEKLCMQYVDAMAYIHSKTDLHRDISYSNVMVTSNNDIKILDFGFAKNLNDDTNYDTSYNDIQRKFVLPREQYTSYTEVYCIGAILYTIITGKLFDNTFDINNLETSNCNDKLKEGTRICLSEKAEQRFKNAQELKNYLVTNTCEKKENFYSLDSFRDIIKRGIELHFSFGNLPTNDIIKKWIEVDLKDIIESSTFQSTINLLTLLFRLPHLKKVTYQKNLTFDLDKSLFISMYDFYIILPDSMKLLFIKNVCLIIKEKSQADQLEEELPFN
ncbi:hypothetical protein C805_00300 [Eubacterium sp. 14-2]|uniref:protein kinase domain-containing protein n=1 Tax=Eubacterium sp. 14-2 TaxID=1235790 RepID=UPI000338DEE2|nr:protein kinase [Eubacterium sp. 14-2]EOT28779.1 hypothetical protein C805_00300 [Eubacterium sp. 14-2]